KTELSKFRKILETKQEELERIVRKRDAITIEKSADALDEVQHAAERELAIRNLDRESQLLRSVRSALRRIDEGSFGICQTNLHQSDEEPTLRYGAAATHGQDCGSPTHAQRHVGLHPAHRRFSRW